MSTGVMVVNMKPASLTVSMLVAQFSMKKLQRTKTTSGAALLRMLSAALLERISPCAPVC